MSWVVVAWLAVGGSGMKKDEMKLSLNGVGASVLFNSKGIAAGGRIHAQVSGQFLSGIGDHPQPLGYLMVLTLDQKEEWWDVIAPSLSDEHLAICGAPAMARYQISAVNGSYENVTIGFTLPTSDRYSLLFALCEASGSFQGQVSWSYVNLDLNGQLNQYLPIEHTPLPIVFVGLACVYATLFFFWAAECVRLKEHVVPVQLAVLLSLAAKIVETASQAVFQAHMNSTGLEKGRYWLLAKFSEGISDFIFLVILLLVSVGWTITRFQVTPRERTTILVTFGMLAALTSSRILCNYYHGECQGLLLGEYIMRSLTLLAIIVAMNFNITQLRQVLAEVPPPITPHMATQYAKIHIFQVYRWAFLAYLLAPTALLILEAAVLIGWEFDWVNDALYHLVFLLIYVHVGTSLAPMNLQLISRAFDRN